MKKYHGKTLFLLLTTLLLSTCQIAKAQVQIFNTVRGVILDENQQPLPFVHVMAIKGRFGATTDEKGRFVVKSNETDTLWCSFVGYQMQRIPVQIPDGAVSIDLSITLSPTTYKLKNVDVTLLPENIEDFKDEVIEQDLKEGWQIDPKNNYEAYMKSRRQQAALQKTPIPGFDQPDAFNFLTLDLKKGKRIKRREQKRKRQHIAANKFNKNWVLSLIGPENEAIVEEFMKTCKFSESYLVETDQYQIAKDVLNNWDLYQDQQKRN